MKRNVTFQRVSSTLVLSTLSLSFLPSLVRAQELQLHDESVSPVVEDVPTVLDTDPVTDGSDNVSKKEVKQALQNIEGLLDDSQGVEVTRDADSAAIVTSESGTTVDLPKDPSDAIVFSSDDVPAIEITLPQADESKKAKTIDDGVVAYPGRDGSANAIQATEDGSVKMLTIIDNANAPTAYTYGITVPEGGRVELTSDGGAVVLDTNEQPIAIVQTPWATDALGTSLETCFTTDGVSLTQHIMHNIDGVSYPVTADPWWAPARIARVEWVNTSSGRSLHVYMTWYGYIISFLSPVTSFNEVMQKAGIGWSRKLYYQFVCHAQFAPPFKESWNLDTWRPDVSYFDTVMSACNPN